MKQYIVLLAIAVFTAIGCSQPSATAPASVQNSQDPMAAGGAVDPIITYTTSPVVPIVNQPCTITATMQQNITGTNAKLVLSQSTNGGGSYQQVNGGTQGAQSVSYTFTPTSVGDLYFKVHFVAGGSGYSNNFDYFFTVPVIPKPVSTTIAPKITAVSSVTPKNLHNGYYRFSVRFMVSTYADPLTNAVLSGSLINNATVVSTSVAPTSVVGTTPPVVTWNLGSIAAASNVYRTITFDVPATELSGVGPWYITGTWTITADDFVNVPVSGVKITTLPL
jgi:hypothetical protein